jgi:subtilisin family serine protease
VRVAVIDSGVHAPHPHVPSVVGGASVRVDPSSDSVRVHLGDFDDVIGHGTAVAAAIHEKAPDADIWAVKVFAERLATSAPLLAAAIDHAAESAAHVVNLSLGSRNAEHAPMLEAAVQRARGRGALVVSALTSDGLPCYPGCLAGVVGVLVDPDCPRDELRVARVDGRVLCLASPDPRPIPGVPPERNLSGISFAVANVSGFLARLVEGGLGIDELLRAPGETPANRGMRA